MLTIAVVALYSPQEEDPEKYQAHFAEYLKNGVEPDELEDLYTKVNWWLLNTQL